MTATPAEPRRACRRRSNGERRRCSGSAPTAFCDVCSRPPARGRQAAAGRAAGRPDAAGAGRLALEAVPDDGLQAVAGLSGHSSRSARPSCWAASPGTSTACSTSRSARPSRPRSTASPSNTRSAASASWSRPSTAARAAGLLALPRHQFRRRDARRQCRHPAAGRDRTARPRRDPLRQAERDASASISRWPASSSCRAAFACWSAAISRSARTCAR